MRNLTAHMKHPLAGVALACLALFTPLSAAQATTLDFTTMANGSVSTIGDVTFSLAGAGETGDPTVDSQYGGGLWNSNDGSFYPTAEILRADFSSTVSGLSFTYDPEGYNGNPLQAWSLFDSAYSLIATGAFTSGSSAFYDLSAYSGIARIEWHNGQNDWLSALEVLTYTPSAATVPVPAALPLLVVALGGLGVASRRRKAA